MKFILGRKIEMTQVFDEKGNAVAVTLVAAGPCFVCGLKTKEIDGYEAVQLGFEKKKDNKVKKTEKGKEYKVIKEFKQEGDMPKVKDEINVSVFEKGDLAVVSSVSKGKGFQGGVKRWGFKGRNQTHGVKHEHRTLGSVGSAGPARVFPGRKMPGRTGFNRKTVRNLEILKIDKENNVLALRGAVPGRRGSLVEIKV